MKLKGLRSFGVTLVYKLTFEIHLREFVSKAARSLGVVRLEEKLFDCPRALKSSFNSCVGVNFASTGSTVHCLCSIRFITERTTIYMSICIILSHILILEHHLL